MLLQSRQRAVEAHGDDGCGVGDGQEVGPKDTWPTPRCEPSNGHEQDERQVDHEHQVSQTGIGRMGRHQRRRYAAA